MKIIKLILIIILFQLSSYAQGDKPVISLETNLIGLTSKEDFNKLPYKEWFDSHYNDYEFDEITVNNIKKHIKDITIKAFMGTWCEDSQRETPALYKLLDSSNFDYKNLTMITVNRAKKTPDNLQEGLNIFRVPTFIFYRNEKEIGRFVEYPRETLEEDILKIVSGQPYKHSYEDE